jgi:hypothetical protein
MSQTAVGTNVDKAFNIQLHLAAQVAFNYEFMIDHFTEAGDLVFSEITYSGVRANARFR